MKKILIMCLAAALSGSGAAAAEPLPPGNQGYTPNSQDMHYFEKTPPGPVELPHGAIKKIRLQKVTDPRCPDIGEEDLKKVLLKANELAQKHLGLELMFTLVGDMPLQTFMQDEEARLAEYFVSAPAMLPPGAAAPALDAETAAVIRNGGWRDLLKKAEYDIWGDDPEPPMGKMLSRFNTTDSRPRAEYYPKGLRLGVKPTEEEKRRLLEYYKSRQAALKELAGPDKQPLLDRNHRSYFSSSRWRKLLQGATSYDFVITNTPLLDTSKYFAFPSFMRGGILNGFLASINPTIGVVTSFPILSKADFFKERDLRSQEERNLALAAIIVHELGHQLRGLEDDFTGAVPLMNPPQMFRYGQWVKSFQNAAPAWKQQSPQVTK